MKKEFRNNGITLVALVITIIILLILAGITIAQLTGSGLFENAQLAEQKSKEAQEKENLILADYENQISEILNGGNETKKLPENTPTTPSGTQVKKPEGKNWDESKINSYADGEGNTIPVPAGFIPITVAEGQGTMETGFVIRNEDDGNEFVWIPVDGMSYTYERYDFGLRYGSYSDYSETMPSDEETSVAMYGGYYIGRYEAGIEGGTLSSESNSTGSTNWTGWTGGTLVVQSGKQVWNWITRNKAVEVAGGLYNKTDDNAVSKLCSSYAWDTALKFIETKYPTYATNSTQGNYADKSATLGQPALTGRTDAVSNIYDMGGNVWDWTTESYGNSTTPWPLRRRLLH